MKEEINEIENIDDINDTLDVEYDDTAIEEDFDNECDDKGLSSGSKLALLFVGAGLCGILFSGVLLKFINWIIFN